MTRKLDIFDIGMGHGGKRPGAGKPKGYKAPQTLAREAKMRQLLVDADLEATAWAEGIRRQSFYDLRELFDEQGNMKPIHQLTEAQASMIASFELVIKNAAAGDGHTDRVLKIRLVDRLKAMELAARHLGLLHDTRDVHVKGEMTHAFLVDMARKLLHD